MTRLLVLSLGVLTLLAACASDKQPMTDAERQQVEAAVNIRRSGNPQQAVAMLRDALAQHPDDAALLTQLGYALIETGKPEASKEAVTVFDKVIALQPGNASAYTGKAVAFDHTGNHLAAQDLYEQALRLEPGSVSIRNNLGMSLILNGQYDRAITLFEALRQDAESNKTVQQNLALAYGLKGDPGKAMSLNLKDLPEEQAKENLQFYDTYASRMRKQAPDSSMQIGFTETPAAIAEEPTKTAPVKPVMKKPEVAPLVEQPSEPEADDTTSSFPSSHPPITY